MVGGSIPSAASLGRGCFCHNHRRDRTQSCHPAPSWPASEYCQQRRPGLVLPRPLYLQSQRSLWTNCQNEQQGWGRARASCSANPSGGGPKCPIDQSVFQSLVPGSSLLTGKQVSCLPIPRGRSPGCPELNCGPRAASNIHKEAGKPTWDCTQARQGGGMQLREGLLCRNQQQSSPWSCVRVPWRTGSGNVHTPHRQGSMALSLYTFPTNSI